MERRWEFGVQVLVETLPEMVTTAGNGQPDLCTAGETYQKKNAHQFRNTVGETHQFKYMATAFSTWSGATDFSVQIHGHGRVGQARPMATVGGQTHCRRGFGQDPWPA
jgi:hypothetical protein